MKNKLTITVERGENVFNSHMKSGKGEIDMQVEAIDLIINVMKQNGTFSQVKDELIKKLQ